MRKVRALRQQAAKLKNIGINSGSDLLVVKTRQLSERADQLEERASPAHEERSAGAIRLTNSGTHAKALVTIDDAVIATPDGRLALPHRPALDRERRSGRLARSRTAPARRNWSGGCGRLLPHRTRISGERRASGSAIPIRRCRCSMTSRRRGRRSNGRAASATIRRGRSLPARGSASTPRSRRCPACRAGRGHDLRCCCCG